MRIVFCGTGAFGAPSLRALVQAGLDVPFVVTQPDRPAGRSHEPRPSAIKILAGELGLRVEQPEKLGDPPAVELLRAADPDAIVVVSYGQILRKHVLDLPPLGCLNIHGSLLPRHRGASPIHASILAGDQVTGVTVIRMDEGVDTGPIVASASEPIRPRDTFETLHDRLAGLGATIIVPAIIGLSRATIVLAPQDGTGATRAKILRKEDGRLDWSRSAVDLDRAIRALNPWPGTFGTLSRGTSGPLDVTILEAEPTGAPRVAGVPAGSVTEARGTDLVVACGEGLLALRRVKPSGRKTLEVGEFLRGYGVAAGDMFVQTRPPERRPS